MLAVGVLVEGDDRGAEMGQVVGGGEPGDAEPGDHGADAGPVVVAAERASDVGTVHAPATHWA